MAVLTIHTTSSRWLVRPIGTCLVVLVASGCGGACTRPTAAFWEPPPTLLSLGRMGRRRRRNAAHPQLPPKQHVDSHNVLSSIPAEATRISTLVQQRAQARRQGNYEEADRIRTEIARVPLEDAHTRIVLTDIPRKDGGGSSWRLVSSRTQPTESEGSTVLQLAHAALGLAVESAKQGVSVPEEARSRLVKDAMERAKTETGAGALQGRKAADAAFWFALAGVTEEALFESLTVICTSELERCGSRSSCRAKDVWQVLERLSAAGIRDRTDLEELAFSLLKSKGYNPRGEEPRLPEELLDLHSDRCLLGIWKFSTRQRKQRTFLQAAMTHWDKQEFDYDTLDELARSTTDVTIDWSEIYHDPTRPLIIDVGCGMGVSLLGLASMNDGDDDGMTQLMHGARHANLAGVDLSGLAIGYAQGIAERWKVCDRIHFFRDTAEHFLGQVIDSYPGPVGLCFVQFPTPYRLTKSSCGGGGNSQLPANVNSGFMVTKELLRLIHRLLQKQQGNGHSRLILQSNCEDVAVWMRTAACEDAGFRPDLSLAGHMYIPSLSDTEARLPKRTLDWIAMGGERAQGKGWYTTPLLPRRARTETEVACSMNGTPVHRCILVPDEPRLPTFSS